MYTFSKYFSEFVETFILDNNSEYLNEILKSIQNNFEYDSFELILKQKGIRNIEDIKLESLDLLISYANFILKDDIISGVEIQDFTFLKRIFKIREGDFVKNKNFAINEVLKKEFIRIYSDNHISEKETLLQLNLQSLFDLSYDEFEHLKKDEIINSLLQGANPRDLDITKIPKGLNILYTTVYIRLAFFLEISDKSSQTY